MSRTEVRWNPTRPRLDLPQERRDEWFKQIGERDLYVRAAEAIAAGAHAGQARKFAWDEPYIEHPIRVANIVGRSREYGHDHEVVAAALLHDVVEDTTITPTDLIRLGMSDRTVMIVTMVTHYEGVSARDYIMAMGRCPEAWVIKRADICDNLSTTPGPGMVESSERLWRKYPERLAWLAECAPVAFPSPFVSPYDL